MSRTTCVLIALLAVVPFAARHSFAQQTLDDGTPIKKPRRAVQAATAPTAAEDPDASDADGRPDAAESPPPATQPAARARSNKPARGEMRDKATAARVQNDPTQNAQVQNPRAKNASRAADDDSVDRHDDPAAFESQVAGSLNRSRDPRAPQRQTTINRAAVERAQVAAAQPRSRRATYVQAQFEDKDPHDDDPNAVGAALGLSPEDEETRKATGPSLEEQVAELKARLDAVTAAQNTAAIAAREPALEFGSGNSAQIFPTANQYESGNVSTVQGSVFGPDNGASGIFAADNLTFTSQDGNFKAHIGGVVQLDVIGFANTPSAIGIPPGSGINEATNFRRLRIRGEGTMYQNIDWVSELDLSGFVQNMDQRDGAAQNVGLRSFPVGVGVQAGNTINVIQPTTVYMTIKDVPVLGNVRVGNQQDWFSFEHIESARFLDFMERSPLMDLFSGPNNNGYTPGISAFNNTPDKMAGAQIGIYKNNAYDSGYTFNVGDSWTYGGRLIWTPFYDEESKGRYLLHTGIGSEWRSFNTGVTATQGFDNVRLRSRGDLRTVSATLDPNFLDTGNFYAVSQTLLDPEVAFQWGPFIMQAEYTMSWFRGARAAQNLPNSDLGHVFFQGGYAEALYFLTGENRVYNRESGVFGRVIPNGNFNRAKGQWGAWQVGLRYDWADMNSGTQTAAGSAINGGNASDMTLGLNWFLNPSARFQLNYVCSWINNAAPTTFPGTVGALNGARFTGDGPINSFGARMDFNF